MNITINGEKRTIDSATLTITDLLKLENVKMPEMVTVERNGDIIDRAAFPTTAVNEGDALEFLYFMGGGSFLTLTPSSKMPFWHLRRSPSLEIEGEWLMC
ncbi:MAG: sulfur carrier protein ThiS [Candidatus Margulisiibacteriota bacterium]